MVGTFSIIAYDKRENLIGVAMASGSKKIKDGTLYVSANVGVIVSQGYTNEALVSKGFDLLRAEKTAREVMEYLLSIDPEKIYRQIGIIDRFGDIEVFTGKKSLKFYGHVVGDNFASLGSFITSKRVIEGMAFMFKNSNLIFSDRLILALEYGHALGGNRRGSRSALLIVKKFSCRRNERDTVINIQVADQEDPIFELKQAYCRIKMKSHKE
ncbi:MAG: DUF1028 domain-containing protein [Candidatus Odinarchaeota archaeon]|nr:DUF1028 domain-containing protein [Candidatus Odinarchaeota archaeon]